MYPVTLYTKTYCAFSKRALALLDSKGVLYENIDVTDSDQRFTEMAKRAHGALTVPQIFIGGQHIGGCSELEQLERERKLDAMLGRGDSSVPSPS
ncbi:glutaredoxin 3 [Aggregicoccus sp. 17bor-14]|uniref:glutaredoxin 3 n=1 Tax=Myxococcaceae TaxID=31 RepID=UPI00129C9D9F|nr:MULTISPECIES: glutaredoxin 3 [Myxococcaceae]MBF5045449.1 glutaredoxin 3 [Simulacricoccus sp. 17bor-14]MRI91189.1 glutaredoxin 3 [Aggregicoccus sp. 17bor-14]